MEVKVFNPASSLNPDAASAHALETISMRLLKKLEAIQVKNYQHRTEQVESTLRLA